MPQQLRLEDALGATASVLACLDDALSNPHMARFWIEQAQGWVREWQARAMAWAVYPYQREGRNEMGREARD